MINDPVNAFLQEDRIYEGYGSVAAADAPAIGFDAGPPTDMGGDDATSASSDDEGGFFVETAKTPREMLESAGAALGWPRERIARTIEAFGTLLKYVTGGAMELYDFFATMVYGLSPNFTTEDIEERVAQVVTSLDETADNPSYPGPVFALPDFEASAEIELRDIERRRAGPKLVAGLFKCKKCKSDKTLTNQKQVRSADEGMTNTTICFECGYQWSEHS